MLRRLWKCYGVKLVGSTMITGMKNFSKAWITGSSNQKTSNIVNHATSEQHRAAMVRVRADVVFMNN